WSVRLVAGADLQAADPRLTDPRSSGQMRLADTHYGMRRIPAAGGGLVWTQEGVDNWGDPSLKPGDPLDPEALGYPTICDDFPTWCAASSDDYALEAEPYASRFSVLR
ncbi:hypothetical protein JTL75_35500, partial [Pseudomonas aeruginosa]|nr:hypothetical protein [Pseudomonas aeruginosa]